MSESKSDMNTPKSSKTTGWLWLFCFLLIFIEPLVWLIGIVNHLHALFFYQIEPDLNLRDFLPLILVNWSIFTGISLYRKIPHADRKAKIFLAVDWVLHLFMGAPFLLHSFIGSADAQSIAPMVIPLIVIVIYPTLLCGSIGGYLAFSKKIKTLYRADISSQPRLGHWFFTSGSAMVFALVVLTWRQGHRSVAQLNEGAMALYNAGRFSEASQVALRAVMRASDIAGPDHIHYGAAQRISGMSFEATGDIFLAEASYERALEFDQKNLPAMDRQIQQDRELLENLKKLQRNAKEL